MTGIFGICAECCGEIRCDSGSDGSRRDARSGRIAGKFEHVSHGAALHAGIGTPGPVGIFVAAPPAVIGGIGVDDHSRRAVFLRDEDFHSAKILAVADQHNLAAHVNFQFLELLEIFRRPVVGVNHVGFDVARRRHAVEWHDDARIVLIGIVARRARAWARAFRLRPARSDRR